MTKTKLVITERGRLVRDVTFGLLAFAGIIILSGFLEGYL